ncbi:MAG: 4Fe-4S binding protein [Lachnospiraceae bacterium]|nr:4Fe-4S binding protein [Candidatus Equihabitans merdae]
MAAMKSFPYKAAVVACKGGCRNTSCSDGCIGCRNCIDNCQYGAIEINELGIAEVNESKCFACGRCVESCPMGIIRIHDAAVSIVVKCSNTAAGKDARTQCSVSCIGCGICVKACTASAIHVVNNVAVIDERYCLSCGNCAVKCPRGAISDMRGIIKPRN